MYAVNIIYMYIYTLQSEVSIYMYIYSIQLLALATIKCDTNLQLLPFHAGTINHSDNLQISTTPIFA